MASSPFDDDGVATADTGEVVQDGVLQGYFLSTLFGAQAGHADHRQCRRLPQPDRQARKLDFQDLLREMGRGLLITELLGQGVNYVTGDYSRGAAGYWVEDA